MMGSVTGLRGRRCQDLQDEDEGALRPGAAVARQALLQRALHDAGEGRRDRSQHADQGRGRDRLRPVHLQGRRMEAGREDGLRQEPQVQAAQRARLGPGRRQGGQGRPGRVDRDARRADPGRRHPERRDRHDRGARPRPAAAAGGGQEHQAAQLQSDRQPVHLPLQQHGQAVRQSQDPPRRVRRLRPGGLPQGHDRRSAVVQGLQGAVRLRHAAGQRRRHGRRAERQCRQGQAAPARRRATTARRSC